MVRVGLELGLELGYIALTRMRTVTLTPSLTYPIHSLTTDDAFWCRQTLATCYQLVQSVRLSKRTLSSTCMKEVCDHLLKISPINTFTPWRQYSKFVL